MTAARTETKTPPQIVFFLTPEEEQSPLIQEYKNIVKEQYKLKQKQLNLWTKIRDAAVLTEEDSEIPF